VGERHRRTLAREFGFDKRRKGLGFYTRRHTFRTAADSIMGHRAPATPRHDREATGHERPKAVSDHIRKRVFGEAE
jgi:hypothetical protein